MTKRRTEAPAKLPEPPMRIEYEELSRLKKYPGNPKLHDLESLGASMDEQGFVDPIVIDERTGMIGAGHGRLEELERRRDAGETPPARIIVVNGEWCVPVIRGISFKDDEAFRKYVIGANRISEIGGWDNRKLADMLGGMDATALLSTGFDEGDVVKFMSLAAGPTAPGAFPEVGADLATNFCCPKCSYRWSGNPMAGEQPAPAPEPEAPAKKKRAGKAS